MPNPIVTEGARLLEEWAKSSGYNQNKAAKYIGVERLTYRRWESGFGLPSLCWAFRLEDKLGIPARSWTVPAQSEVARG